MADVVTPLVRSRMMAGITGKNTKPELIIRRGLHRLGIRFSLHRKDLPGKPDLVLAKYNAAVLVNGCFWHGHNCSLFKWPSSRSDFWRKKIDENKARDKKNELALDALGWRYLVVWECALKGRNRRVVDDVISMCITWLKGNDLHGSIRER